MAEAIQVKGVCSYFWKQTQENVYTKGTEVWTNFEQIL